MNRANSEPFRLVTQVACPECCSLMDDQRDKLVCQECGLEVPISE